MPLRVCLAHNHYQQPGGEDQVFAAECRLLRERGHPVQVHRVHNDSAERHGRARLAAITFWNQASYRSLRAILRDGRSDVLHLHNTLPLLSPAAYYAARAEGAVVVQTLHNYRLLCPAATFFRQGRVCEECLGKFPLPGVVHGCYRESRAATAVVASMVRTHGTIGTWARAVDIYIALTEFARQKFIEGGLPAEKIVVKPNFLVTDPGAGSGDGGYAIFVGRLTPEKGISTLLTAWRGMRNRLPLVIIGDGPLAPEVESEARTNASLIWLGRQPHDRVLGMMKRASFLLFPSTWYEGFPMTLVEAFATGLPVLASKLGSMSALIEHGRTGLHFRPGDPDDLAAQVEWLLEHPSSLAAMRRESRAEFERNYTAARNYTLLTRIYDRARSASA